MPDAERRDMLTLRCRLITPAMPTLLRDADYFRHIFLYAIITPCHAADIELLPPYAAAAIYFERR